MVNWYLRTGEVTHDMELVEKCLSDPKYKLLKQDYTDSKHYWVSTVWLGLNHNYSAGGEPLIFETMVFTEKGGNEYYHNELQRYSTEKQALEGHKSTLKRMQSIEDLEAVKKTKGKSGVLSKRLKDIFWRSN